LDRQLALLLIKSALKTEIQERKDMLRKSDKQWYQDTGKFFRRDKIQSECDNFEELLELFQKKQIFFKMPKDRDQE